MYPIETEEIFVLKRVFENPLTKNRFEAMVEKIKPKKITQLTDKTLQKLVNNRDWNKGYKHRTGFYRRQRAPTLIFNTFRWSDLQIKIKKIRYPRLARALLLGQDMITLRGERNHLERNICQKAWEVHSIFGCLHACDYCHVEDFVNIMVNIEEMIEYLKIFIQEHPEQQLYKYDNYSDIPAFEPEYNACIPLVEFFAKQDNQYLLLYTKSDNIDFLLDEKIHHNGHTIINWSISPDTQSRLIEKEAPPLQKRIIAMKKCQERGYTVRARFSPLIPIKNWQKEMREMVKMLFKEVKPDIITIDIIGFMKPDVMLNVIDKNLFDDEARNILERLAKKKKLYGKHTFPHEFRKKMFQEIIKYIKQESPVTPIALCNETPKMWEELKDLFDGMDPNDYACCCGPDSVPGNKWLVPQEKK